MTKRMLLLFFILSFTVTFFSGCSDRYTLQNKLLNANASELVLQLQDMPIGYTLVNASEISIYKGDEEIVKKNIENELKSTYFAKYKSDDSKVYINQDVSVYSEKGIVKESEYNKKLMLELLNFSSVKEINTPLIGEWSIAVKADGISDDDYLLVYVYKNILVQILVQTNENIAEEIVKLGMNSLNKIKEYESK